MKIEWVYLIFELILMILDINKIFKNDVPGFPSKIVYQGCNWWKIHRMKKGTIAPIKGEVRYI